MHPHPNLPFGGAVPKITKLCTFPKNHDIVQINSSAIVDFGDLYGHPYTESFN